jgi:hypothetical protein
MKSLAKAIVESAAFLELSGDEVIDPDSAVQAIESISHSLQSASDQEKRALLDYCRDQASKLGDARSPQEEKRRDFYCGFGEALGLPDK